MKWLPDGELARVHFFGAVEAECQWQLVRPQHHLLGPPVADVDHSIGHRRIHAPGIGRGNRNTETEF